jgi:flagellar protein FlbD
MGRARNGDGFMIQVTRLNGQEVYVNADLILFLEKSPDTVMTLQSGKKLMVKEEIDEVVNRIVGFKSRCFPFVTERSKVGTSKED